MNPMTYRPLRAQRVRAIPVLALFLFLTEWTGQLSLEGIRHHAASIRVAPFLLITLVGVAAIVVFANALIAGFVVDDRGGRTTGLRRRRFLWADIDVAEIFTTVGKNGSATRRVRLTPTSGKPFMLPALFDLDGPGGDPEFDAKAKSIVEWWQAAREPVAAE